ncbi:hypothetical protein [Aestuariivivens insulae]|uniref:hypothetical protein n=1 Tax=Aestuariivivens insulae TaxID=1621988 RepID=UPI001F575B92|nr:hypothetical protein [Aestuariivivens insulae]
MADNVSVDFPTKKRFYKFFKRMVKCAKHNSKGQLIPIMKFTESKIEQKEYSLSFYDAYHKYSRLTLPIIETEEVLHLDINPF